MDKSEREKYASTTKEYRYMCPICFNYVKKPCAEHLTSVDEEDIAERGKPNKCPKCGHEKMFVIDARICDAVQDLNRKGYFTRFCCEGHVYKEDSESIPYISFESKIWKSPNDLHLPSSWYAEKKREYKSNGKATLKTAISIYAKEPLAINDDGYYEKFASFKEKALKDIKSWAKSIPKKQGFIEKLLVPNTKK